MIAAPERDAPKKYERETWNRWAASIKWLFPDRFMDASVMSSMQIVLIFNVHPDTTYTDILSVIADDL